jgi:hypothetical protein
MRKISSRLPRLFHLYRFDRICPIVGPAPIGPFRHQLARLQPRNLLRPARQHLVGATLAIPYGWWNFRDEQMLGVRITAWGQLPIEEVCLWMAVTYATVIVYETVKCWEASGKSIRHALFGEPATRT